MHASFPSLILSEAVTDAPVRVAPRIKLFVHHDPAEAELTLNAWLQEGRVEVLQVLQSQSELGGRFILVLSVLYRTLEMN